MRLKSELYKKEQEEIISKIITILNLENKKVDSKNINIYDYDYVVLNNKDTLTVNQYLYLKNSGYFTWSSTPLYWGTSYTVFNNNVRNSIYNNGRLLNILHIRYR